MIGPVFLLNGQVSDNLSILDRGLHYGDGLFETIAVADGQPLIWQAHFERLRNGCERLNLEFPNSQELLNEVLQLCSTSERSTIKILITRGPAGRGYKSPAKVETTRVVAHYSWPDYTNEIRTKGVSLTVCNHRLGWNPELAGIKHLNRLEQVLARSEWEDEFFDGIMLDIKDNVIECTMSNIFIINQESLRTPKLEQCGIRGIIREIIMKRANKLGLEMIEQALSIDDIYQADEVFITNSIIGLCPVNMINERKYNNFNHADKILSQLLDEKMIAQL